MTGTLAPHKASLVKDSHPSQGLIGEIFVATLCGNRKSAWFRDDTDLTVSRLKSEFWIFSERGLYSSGFHGDRSLRACRTTQQIPTRKRVFTVAENPIGL
ncbi:uncharacterized protein LDX57_012070 [Aspergillus melleus]|uniref:uncharacterized protein n=1 Tax=Aspergillus melleus TaxID=138277 RepID=UPI001E8D2A13|nr:uncharacterized protein LDX57_012070 [Aspergillus melleus]KAH8434423.1 hypothetical protein LDX57_012070 [Aspergillus melleus]